MIQEMTGQGELHEVCHHKQVTLVGQLVRSYVII